VRLQLLQKLTLASIVVASVAAGSLTLLAPLAMPGWAAFLVASLLGGMVGVLIALEVSRNFRNLRDSAEQIAGGNLTADVSIPSRLPLSDESSDVARSLEAVLGSLRELTQHLDQTGDRVAQASNALSGSTQDLGGTGEEIAGTVDQVAQGAVRQQDHVTDGSKRIREVAADIRSSAEAAHGAFGFVSESSQRAGAGLDAARNTTTKMQSMFEQVEKAGNLVIQFDDKIRSVRHITEMITSVAEKTHLLSLNASIEAARAGDAGRGFSVVAEEIRHLAESAGSSAEKIDLLIQQVEDEAARISEVMRELSRGVGEGREQLNTILHSFEQILSAIQEAARRSEGLFEQADRQVAGTEEVVSDIDRVAEVTAENVRATEAMRKGLAAQAKTLEEILTQAKELEKLSTGLREVVGRFRTR
jgi:methyl-accepting chemotaxis protein